MKYKLIGNNDYSNVKHTILKNRGVKDIEKYLKLDSSCLYDYELLDNIYEGYKLLKNTIDNNLYIYIIVDSDVDGYSSAGILYHYIKNHIGYNNIIYLLHTSKQHGLSEDIILQIDKNKKGLIILPDAGTNDVGQCKYYSELGFKILILDHHQKEIDNPYAVIINNQLCDYPNKNLCGVGIVYKFLQLLDDEYWLNNADDYIDLVALGNISDVMDLRECETKYLVDKGLKNIEHYLLKAIIQQQAFSIRNINNITINDVSFYVAPLINAIIRIGEQEDKEMLFKAFIQQFEEFIYKPRKSKNNPNPVEILESIYDRIARIGKNLKEKQSRLQEKAVNEIVELFDENNINNTICFINATRLESVTSELTGLVAIKIADIYNKPCLVLRRHNYDKEQNKNEIIFSGSARNVNDGFIEDLKTELENTGLFKSLIGHSNAFGVSIKKENIPLAIKYFNDKYKNIEKEKVYKVDFIFEQNIDYKIIKDIYNMQHLFSSFVKEPLIAIKNVYVDFVGFKEFGNEKRKHWKFQNGIIQYIKFNINDDDKLINYDTFSNDHVIINVIGKVTINQYGGIVTPQVIIEDYEIVNDN